MIARLERPAFWFVSQISFLFFHFLFKDFHSHTHTHTLIYMYVFLFGSLNFVAEVLILLCKSRIQLAMKLHFFFSLFSPTDAIYSMNIYYIFYMDFDFDSVLGFEDEVCRE